VTKKVQISVKWPRDSRRGQMGPFSDKSVSRTGLALNAWVAEVLMAANDHKRHAHRALRNAPVRSG